MASTTTTVITHAETPSYQASTTTCRAFLVAKFSHRGCRVRVIADCLEPLDDRYFHHGYLLQFHFTPFLAAAAAAADTLAGRHDAGSAVCAPLAVDPSCPARCWVTSKVATFPNSTLAPSSLLLRLLLIPPTGHHDPPVCSLNLYDTLSQPESKESSVRMFQESRKARKDPEA